MGEIGSEGQDTAKVCSECGLKVSKDAIICEHCGNVFRKTQREENEATRRSR